MALVFKIPTVVPIVIVFIVPACLIVLKLRVGEPLGQYLIPSFLNNLGTAVMLLKGHQRRGKDRIEPFDFHLHFRIYGTIHLYR